MPSCVAVVPPFSPIVKSAPLSSDRTSIPFRSFVNPRLEAEQSYDLAWRRAEIPAAGGQGNARGVARAQHAVANGGESNGHRLLGESTLNRILDVQAAGRDLVLGIGVTFGVGYDVNAPLLTGIATTTARPAANLPLITSSR